MKYVKIPKDRIKHKTINSNQYLYYRFMIDGKDKTIYGKSIKELEQKYNSYLNADEEISSKTLGTLFELYLSQKQKSWKVQTYNSRLNFYKKHIKTSSLSKMKISKINKPTICTFIEKLNLSNSTKKEKLNVLSQFFNWCIDKSYIKDNPTKSIKIDIVSEEVELIDSIIIERILADCKGLNIEAPILLLLNGCRLGESLGANINNLGDDYIYIKESLTKCTINNKTVTFLEPPKTNQSIRKVYLSKDIVNRLKHCNHSEDGYYCKGLNGWYSRNRIYGFLKKYGVVPHELRKYYTTYLLMNNVNIYTVKRQIGHSKSSPYTENTYLKNVDRWNREEMNNFFNR